MKKNSYLKILIGITSIFAFGIYVTYGAPSVLDFWQNQWYKLTTNNESKTISINIPESVSLEGAKITKDTIILDYNYDEQYSRLTKREEMLKPENYKVLQNNEEVILPYDGGIYALNLFDNKKFNLGTNLILQPFAPGNIIWNDRDAIHFADFNEKNEVNTHVHFVDHYQYQYFIQSFDSNGINIGYKDRFLGISTYPDVTLAIIRFNPKNKT